MRIFLNNKDNEVQGSIYLKKDANYLTVDLSFENNDCSMSVTAWSDMLNEDVPILLRAMADQIEKLQDKKGVVNERNK